MTKIKEKARAGLHFPKDGGVLIKGLDKAVLDQEITVLLKGKLTGVNTSDWDGGKHVELVLTSCELHGKQVKVTLDEALQQAERKR
ncbi:MAG: hypothetical protein ACOY4W_16740 [Thermodesulfobacteriota bacterium]